MKPMATKEGEVGLLEYLEDIIGSNQYIEDIERIDSEILMQSEERIEKINKVKAAQSELNGMEDEKNMAVNYVKMEQNSMVLNHLQYFIELSEYVRKFNEYHQKKNEMKQGLVECQEEAKRLIGENADMVQEFRKMNEIKVELEEKIEGFQE